jgi:hypothetical protein
LLNVGISRSGKALIVCDFIFSKLKTIKMKTKITGRDLKFFFLGVLTIILLDLVFDWDNNITSFKKGYNDVRKTDTVR